MTAMRPRALVLGGLLVGLGVTASAHTPFSSADVRIRAEALDVTIVAQAYDLAHDLGVDPPDQLLDPGVLAGRREAISNLFGARLAIAADGETLAADAWSIPAMAVEQQLIRIQARYDLQRLPGRVAITARLFPYDPTHQTLVNVYERDQLKTQQILDVGRPEFDYFTETRAGLAAVVRRFVVAGLQRALSGYDHLLFLVGLLLLGGSRRQILMILGAFTVSYSAGLSCAAFGLLVPPARLLAPAVALSLIYVGIDNLMVGGGRDVRAWVAFAFGALHGFSFAGALASIDRPTGGVAWSVVSFNVGLEIGLMLVAIGAASIVALSGAPSPGRGAATRRLVAVTGSIVVALTGAVWFVRGIFFV